MAKESHELIFLLKLLGHNGYRSSIKDLAPTSNTKAGDRDKICRDLATRDIVDYSYDVNRFSIESAGKALIKADPTQIPLSEKQLAVLNACKDKSATPGQVKKLPAAERQGVIQELETKGLVKISKATIKEVWLTDRGTEYLRDDLQPSGTVSRFNLKLFCNYLNFLRKSHQPSRSTIANASSAQTVQDIPSDEEILKLIKELDQTIGTENYLPIFHLRQKLQPPMSRDDLDQALYRLQRQDQLELSSLVETVHYSSAQIDAGIPQNSGGPLFFLAIND